MPRTGSHTEVQARSMIEACEAYLADRAERIAHKRERMIERAMRPRWFGRRRTREEAIAFLQHSGDDFVSQWVAAEIEGGGWATMVEGLLKMARIAQRESGTVMLDDMAVSALTDYWPTGDSTPC